MVCRALVLSSWCAVLLHLPSCSSPSRGGAQAQQARVDSPPILIGTLVDGDGHALTWLSTTLNHWSENGGSGGREIATDHEGRFRIELSAEFLERSSGTRTLGLVGDAAMAIFDGRGAFVPGVQDIGDLLFADPADTRALSRLSDECLLARLELFRNRGMDCFDACLRECARRGGPRIIAYLDGMRLADGWATDTTLATARNRAARLADPLALELVDDSEVPLSCTVAELPVVRLAFVNRDPLGRTLRVACSEPDCHDPDLAVDCTATQPGLNGFSLVRPPHSGLWLGGGSGYELAPGEAGVFPVRLSHYVRIDSPGLYRLRFAFRLNGIWELDEGATQLPRGVMFLYSKHFLLNVSAPDARSR